MTQGTSHLLRAPFSIHPKTGRVCLPFDPALVDKFNPDTVPTVNSLIEEVNAVPGDGSETAKKKKSSLVVYIELFEHFISSLTSH